MQQISLIKFRIKVIVALLVIAVGCTPNNTTISTLTTTPNITGVKKIAFASNRSGNYDIYIMNANGSEVTQLTNSPKKETSPIWSPDGTKIAFLSHQSNKVALYVMNADGADQVLLTEAITIGNPSWSPNGQYLAFITYPNDQSRFTDIFLIRVDGTGLTNVTNGTWAFPPTWSSDSRQLVFGGGHPAIYRINVDGSGLTDLTNGPPMERNWEPTWSPDGKQIAFISERDGNWEIYSIHPDGSGAVNLTRNAGYDFNPVWSPSGERLAFISGRAEHGPKPKLEIYAMNADGSNVMRLTHGWASPAEVIPPSWSPDGQQLVAVAEDACNNCNKEIFVINADGAGMMNITNNPADDTDAVWQP